MDNDVKVELDKRLKVFMKRRNFSFRRLSGETGVPIKTLYGWTAGNQPKKLRDVYKVAQALGISIEELAFVRFGGSRGDDAMSNKNGIL